MAAKFFRRTVPDYTIMPNATYADLFDNNKTTTDIQSGTVGGNQTTSLFIADYNTAAQPTFGGGELVGAKLGLYINSITSGQAAGSAGLLTECPLPTLAYNRPLCPRAVAPEPF